MSEIFEYYLFQKRYHEMLILMCNFGNGNVASVKFLLISNWNKMKLNLSNLPCAAATCKAGATLPLTEFTSMLLRNRSLFNKLCSSKYQPIRWGFENKILASTNFVELAYRGRYPLHPDDRTDPPPAKRRTVVLLLCTVVSLFCPNAIGQSNNTIAMKRNIVAQIFVYLYFKLKSKSSWWSFQTSYDYFERRHLDEWSHASANKSLIRNWDLNHVHFLTKPW